MLNINNTYKSNNFDDVVQKQEYVILHCMCFDDLTSLTFLCEEKNKVSAHFYIARDGEIFNLVDDTKKAWHAGDSRWKDSHYLNTNSIGIEIGNDGKEFLEVEYSIKQYDSLIKLLIHLKQKHNIPAENILAHSDISPERKTDPGLHFNWQILVENNLAIDFYRKDNTSNYMKHIYNFGYCEQYNQEKVIKAFQRRFISDSISGLLDSKTKKFIDNSPLKDKQ